MKLLYPLDNTRITQHFWERPKFYKKFWIDGHNGIDFASDTPWQKVRCKAIANWVISKVKYSNSGYGNEVRIRNDSIEIIYAHLDSIDVKQWESVTVGQKIGIIGTTWNSSWVHLHLWVRKLKNWIVQDYNNWYFGWIDFFDMLTEDIIEVKKSTFPLVYKWVKVRLLDRNHPRGNIVWFYHQDTKEIRLYDYFFTRSDERQAEIMYHEYRHHGYYELPKKYRDFWELISTFDPKLIKALNERAKTNYRDNEYINEVVYNKYSEQDRIPSEDFAEIAEFLFVARRDGKDINFKGFLHIKINLVDKLLSI